MSPRCPELITAAVGSHRIRRCGTKKAKRYLIDWQPADKKQVKQLPLDAIKSAEYDASDRTLSILSRDRNGVVYDRNGVAFVFFCIARHRERSRRGRLPIPCVPAWPMPHRSQVLNSRAPGWIPFSRWVATQVIYPPTLQRFNKSGLVRVAFTVRADGSVCDFRELESSSPLFTQEVIRVMQGAPRWQPATAFGKPVDASYTVALEFNTGSSSNNYRHVLGDFRAGSLQRQFGGY